MKPVQPIVVRPSTHLETIAAAALASGLALAAADPASEPWASWLGGSFTKSVRRAKRPVELDKVRLLDLPWAEISVGGATAIGFAPLDAAGFPPAIKRLQVTGLDLPVEGTVPAGGCFGHPGALVPLVELNADVAMSTGKAAAQAAHAPGAWLLTLGPSARRTWADEPGLHLGTASFAQDAEKPASIVITDNGLTEIAPGTRTARVAHLGPAAGGR
ncbi:hypothetical protein [Arthrobacter sp.]|uniref:hypothetical protein n=1 Tax=Arthrobacter sp. TaxID=1667 RepID=UPI003A9580A1